MDIVDISNEINSRKVMDKNGVGTICVGPSTNELAFSIARGINDCGLEMCPHETTEGIRPCENCPGEY